MFPINALWHRPVKESTEFGVKSTLESVPVKILAFGQETTGDQSNPVAIVLVDGKLRTLDLKDLSGVKL